MNKRLWIAAIMLLTMCRTAIAKGSDKDAGDVLDRAIAAQGGAELLGKISALRVNERGTKNGQKLERERIIHWPDQFRERDTFSSSEEDVVLDHSRLTHLDHGAKKPATKTTRAMLLRQLQFARWWLTLVPITHEASAIRMATDGETLTGRSSSPTIVVEPPSSWNTELVKLSFNQQTHLLERVVWRYKLGAQTIEHTVEILETRDVGGGLKMPWHYKQHRELVDQPSQDDEDMQVTTVSVNPSIDKSTFKSN